jgi:hypothetical protein
METIQVSTEIREKINTLEEFKDSLSPLLEQKVGAEAAYERQIAITIASLLNGKEYQLDGNSVKNPPNAMLDKLAKGICWEERMEMDRADGDYRNALKIIDITEAQLNGFQSINRHLSEA